MPAQQHGSYGGAKITLSSHFVYSKNCARRFPLCPKSSYFFWIFCKTDVFWQKRGFLCADGLPAEAICVGIQTWTTRTSLPPRPRALPSESVRCARCETGPNSPCAVRPPQELRTRSR